MNTICCGCDGYVTDDDVVYADANITFWKCPTCYKMNKTRVQWIRGARWTSGLGEHANSFSGVIDAT